MDSNALIRGLSAPKRKPKRLRRCLNPGCSWVVGGGKLPLESTHIGEYARLTCDARRGVEHVFPKARVLMP